MNSLSPRMESTGIEYPLKTKIIHKTQNVNAKHLHVVSMYSFRTLLRTFALYLWYNLFFSGPQFEKNWLRKLRTIALPLYFMVLSFDYGIQLSIIHVSKYCLMPVTFYPSVVILRGWGLMGIEIEYHLGYASSGDSLFRDTGMSLSVTFCLSVCLSFLS